MALRCNCLEWTGDASIVPAAARTDGTVTGNAVDVSGAENIMVVVSTGTVTDGTHTFSLTECATLTGSYTAVAAADIVCNSTGSSANGAILNTTATHDNAVLIFGYRGTCGYLKAICVSATCTTGAVFGASIIGNQMRHAPTSTPIA
jgi:hypothetical protein